MEIGKLKSLKIYPSVLSFGIVCLLIDLLTIVSSTVQFLLLSNLQQGVNFEYSLLESSDLVQNVLFYASIAAFIVFLILFLIWKVGMYKNTSLFGHRAESAYGMAAGSYFIPILNLFRPLAILYEIIGAVCAGRKKVLLGVLAAFWWFFNIALIIINYIHNRTVPTSNSSIDVFVFSSNLSLVVDIFSFVFHAPMLIFVIVLTKTYRDEHARRTAEVNPVVEEVE